MRRAAGLPLAALSALVLSTLVLAGGCVLSAEGELPDVEVTEHDVAIPAAPANPRGGDVAVTVSFAQKPARAGLNRRSFSEVRVLGVEVSARTGVPDLSFLTSLRLSATSAEAQAAGKPPVELGRYQRTESGAAGAKLVMAHPAPPDVTELWRSAELVFTLEAAGRMPNVAWTADIGLRFEATLTY
jgi:hypothetical protein